MPKIIARLSAASVDDAAQVGAHRRRPCRARARRRSARGRSRPRARPARRARKAPRLARFRSWPALTPRPTRCAAARASRRSAASTAACARRAQALRVGLGVELDAVGADRLRRAPSLPASASMNRLTRTPSARASAISGAQAVAVARRGPSRGRRSTALRCRARRCTAAGRSSRTSVHQVLERVAFDVELGLRASPSAARRARARRRRGCGARRAADGR